jgi:signal peptidase II
MKRLPFFLIALLVAIGDRAAKIAIEHSVTTLDSIPVIPGLLRIIHTENPGAAFGFLASGNAWLRSGVLIGISTLVLIFVAAALWNENSSFRGTLPKLGLALVLGGAAGNLYDRAVRGTVTDFIEVYHGGWSFPAFNVADSAITVGAGLVLIDMLRPRSRFREEAAVTQK